MADLGALPKGRAVVLASGSVPTLVRTLPWMSGPHAAAVTASIRAHDPAAEDTIAEALESLREVEQQEATAGTPWTCAPTYGRCGPPSADHRRHVGRRNPSADQLAAHPPRPTR
ncbi:hypothetical protein ACWT_6133 [Actinoplanes sp. SE50]|uniref:hypothetical protein n=1 Tax=unclassified Actinoplanes TaxID=2626549 RepID=UPI00023ECBC4|nr:MULTISPECIES: hypothetical protein [unclassified Actinoplanes]AEV87150.1 hypothetical protein ACPL_6265 [Actinoplanes sp. SE50/110]ATO85548.1 hypothetical protein ACWT_6133 [Actinoplanes sp. SE50]SLM02961.1 hypothetical protein ACSP50_6246 [Actinoplanes sp. SE50/110]